jgi:hypothetical protein
VSFRLRVVILNVVCFYYCAECLFTECHNAEYRLGLGFYFYCFTDRILPIASAVWSEVCNAKRHIYADCNYADCR